MSDSNPGKDLAMKKGSVVVLKSGGPNMLVTDMWDDQVTTVWVTDEVPGRPLEMNQFVRATLSVLIV